MGKIKKYRPKLTQSKARIIANNIKYRPKDFSINAEERKLVDDILKRGLKFKDEYENMIKLAVRLNLI